MPDGLPEKPQAPSQLKKLFLLAQKILYEERPAVKHIVHFFVEEGKGMRRGWALFFVIATLVSVASWLAADHEANKKISDIQIGFSSSNSFLLGRIDQLGVDVRKLQKTIDEDKTDFNEAKREKDAEIAKLTTEKNTAEQRLSFFESSPEKISMLFSNFFANTPTNLEQFGSLITQFTNSLYSLDFERPKFSISLNGTMLSDRSIVFLQKSREIFLQATNIGGGETADRLTIDFFADLAGTNLVANGWTLEPKSNIGWNQWQMTAQSSLGPSSNFHFSRLVFLYNS